MTDPPPPLLRLPFSFDDTHRQRSRDPAQTITKLLINLIYSSPVTFPFKT